MPRWKIVRERIKRGLCIACGRVRPEAGRVRCTICLEEAADDARARRDAEKHARG